MNKFDTIPASTLEVFNIGKNIKTVRFCAMFR